MIDTPANPPSTGDTQPAIQRPRIKYQVFISSTYADLHKEREKVVWAVLEARHIPAGMENFTATDERGWKTIKRVIDDTDYYVLVLAGLYGSVDSTTGISWTQREYEYATSKGIPVLAFIRETPSTPGNAIETDPKKRKQLASFIEKVRSNHLYKTWKEANDLAAAVASSLRNMIQDDADDNKPRPGWIRGNSIPSIGSFDELARLSAENSRLREKLAAAQSASTPKPVLQLSHPGTGDIIPSKNSRKHSLTKHVPLHNLTPSPLADQRNRTVWMRLSVSNLGSAPARNVVVDISFNPAQDVHLHLNQLLTPEAEREFRNSVSNPSNHCYIDRKTKNSIRQRIKLIAPGSIEPLVLFGAETTTEPVPRTTFRMEVSYKIVTEDGTFISGKFDVDSTWGEEVQVSTLPYTLHIPHI
ncbi:DUF4062 domain-containing protein [Myxococcus sp. AB036A]|uniref:DUF4062 domain-containing protein n=1 Tax=Myxococcus sp. AB036A TaxID=2562793 RepID=UPI001147109F|nr:DUF4062 domain-containing protein [Myxococcus sp. AB036A]